MLPASGRNRALCVPARFLRLGWLWWRIGELMVRAEFLQLLLGVPAFAEVLPGGIGGFDEGDLFAAEPAFELLLHGNGVVNVLKIGEPDKAIAVVSGCEAGKELALVFQDTAAEFAGDSDVEGAAAACYDVHGVGGVFVHEKDDTVPIVGLTRGSAVGEAGPSLRSG